MLIAEDTGQAVANPVKSDDYLKLEQLIMTMRLMDIRVKRGEPAFYLRKGKKLMNMLKEYNVKGLEIVSAIKDPLFNVFLNNEGAIVGLKFTGRLNSMPPFLEDLGSLALLDISVDSVSLQELPNIKSIKVLHLHIYEHITEFDMQLFKQNGLQEMHVHFRGVSSVKIRKCHGLKLLCLNGNIRTLVFEPFDSLQELLIDSNVTNPIIPTFKSLRHLRLANVNGVHIEDQPALKILHVKTDVNTVAIPMSEQLEELKFEKVKSVFVPRLPNLKHLEIFGAEKLTIEPQTVLQKMVINFHQYLGVSEIEFKLRDFPILEEFVFSGSLKHLSIPQDMNVLRRLELDMVSDIEVPALPKLEIMNLRNFSGDLTIKDLPNLEYLWLTTFSNCNVRLSNLHNLERIFVGHAIEHLECRNLSKIRSLSFQGQNVSLSDVRDIEELSINSGQISLDGDVEQISKMELLNTQMRMVPIPGLVHLRTMNSSVKIDSEFSLLETIGCWRSNVTISTSLQNLRSINAENSDVQIIVSLPSVMTFDMKQGRITIEKGVQFSSMTSLSLTNAIVYCSEKDLSFLFPKLKVLDLENIRSAIKFIGLERLRHIERIIFRGTNYPVPIRQPHDLSSLNALSEFVLWGSLWQFLPELPDSLRVLSVGSNPQLTSIPGALYDNKKWGIIRKGETLEIYTTNIYDWFLLKD